MTPTTEGPLPIAGGTRLRSSGRSARVARLVVHDLRLQLRYRLVHATAVLTLLWAVVVVALPAEWRPVAVPLVVFLDLATLGFFFVAGLVLFEKAERVLAALVVTPVQAGDYLVAKVGSMTVLALAASGVVAAAAAVVGAPAWPLLFAAGVVLLSALTTLAGLAAVAPFDSISRFLMPAALPLIVMAVPLLDYLGLGGPWVLLLPTGGPLRLIDGAYSGAGAGTAAVAVVASGVWTVGLAVVARWAFDRYVVGRRGA